MASVTPVTKTAVIDKDRVLQYEDGRTLFCHKHGKTYMVFKLRDEDTDKGPQMKVWFKTVYEGAEDITGKKVLDDKKPIELLCPGLMALTGRGAAKACGTIDNLAITFSDESLYY